MFKQMKTDLQKLFGELKEQGLYKEERIIASPQGGSIKLQDGQEVLNFCANNYLGLSNHPEVVKASQEIMNERGYGLSSVRFICGTQDIHKKLEDKVTEYLGMEDTILYVACFDANAGIFEPLLDEDSAII